MSEKKDNIIIIKCGKGEIRLGPPCPPIKHEFTFDIEKEKEKENKNDIAST